MATSKNTFLRYCASLPFPLLFAVSLLFQIICLNYQNEFLFYFPPFFSPSMRRESCLLKRTKSFFLLFNRRKMYHLTWLALYRVIKFLDTMFGTDEDRGFGHGACDRHCVSLHYLQCGINFAGLPFVSSEWREETAVISKIPDPGRKTVSHRRTRPTKNGSHFLVSFLPSLHVSRKIGQRPNSISVTLLSLN